MRLGCKIALAAAVLQVAGPPQVRGQSEVQFTPHLGMYFPLRPVVDEAEFEGAPLKKRQVGAAVIGGRISWARRVESRVFMEGTFNYSPSLVAISQAGSTWDADGGLLLSSVRAVYRLHRRDPNSVTPEIQLASGLALIHRFGEAWYRFSGTTDLAAVMGLGGRVPLGKKTPVNVRFEIENYVSRVQFQADVGERTRARYNHDTVWSLGFEIPMTGNTSEKR